MDAPDGWRLQPVAEPVSFFDAATRQWTSGSFETAVKSEHPAVVTSSDTTAAASSAFAAAAQHGSASTPAHVPWNGMHRTSGPMPTPPSRQQNWLNAVAYVARIILRCRPPIAPRWAAGLDAAAEGAIRRCVLPWARTRPAGAAGLPCQGPHCGNGAGQSTRTIVWRLQGQQPVQGCWPSWCSPIGAQWTSDWRRCGEPQAA